VEAAAEPALAQAMRGAVGCNHADFLHLSASERQDCRYRLAGLQGAGPATARYGIDPEKRVAFDAGVRRDRFLQEPFLAERPKKGCRPRVTEQDMPVNAAAPTDWRVSVACAVPF